MRSAIVGDAGRVLLGEQALEERGHLGFEVGDGGADLLDARLDDQAVLRPSRRRARSCAARCGPRSLRGCGRSRPSTIRARRRRRRRRGGGGSAASTAEAAWISSTTVLASAARRAMRLVARGLDGGLHGAAQLGHELGRPAGAGGGGRIDHIGRLMAPRGEWMPHSAVDSSATVDPSAGASALGASALGSAVSDAMARPDRSARRALPSREA